MRMEPKRPKIRNIQIGDELTSTERTRTIEKSQDPAKL